VPERVKNELSIGREIDCPRDCFADEVAIDFPSIGGIVERARESFLGSSADEVDTHATDLALSFRDAWRGAVVPLELPLRGTCSTCGGRGETWTEPCGECCGTGDALVHHEVHWPTSRRGARIAPAVPASIAARRTAQGRGAGRPHAPQIAPGANSR
jgi:DnaJ-class molecular chaperone